MPIQIEIENVAANNPKINLDEFREAQEALKALRKSGIVRPTTYDLGMNESKKSIDDAEEEDDHPDCLPAFRRLR